MKKFIATALLLSAAIGAHAADTYYVGAGIGASHVNADCSGTASCDNNDTGYRAYAGYRLSEIFSGELGYIDFGKASASDPAFGTASVKAHAVTLAVAARAKLNQDVSLVGRLGVASVSTQWSQTGLNDVTKTQAKAYLGLEADYALNPQLNLSAFFDTTQATIEKADGETATGTVRLLGVGVQYGF